MRGNEPKIVLLYDRFTTVSQFCRMNPENCDPTLPIAKNGENTATYTDHAGELPAIQNDWSRS